MKRSTLVGSAVALLFSLAATPGIAADAATIKEAAATAGGTIVVQSALFEALNARMAEAFNKAYGKDGLNVKIARIQTGQQAALYDQELRAGKVSGDVMFMADPGLFLSFATQQKVTPYCSPNYKDFKPEAVNKDCTHFTSLAYFQYLGYNTDIVKGGDIPKSWNDLLDPKWKGKISIPDPKVGGGNYYFVFTIYKLFGKEWFEKVRANQPMLTQSHGTANNQLLSGERSIAVDLSILVRQDGDYPGAKGGPVKEAFPAEGGALIAADMAITKNGPNPAGAKVFMDWASSLDGQKVIAQQGHFSLRKDFTSSDNTDLSKVKYHVWDPAEMDKFRDQWTAESLKILAGQ